MGATVKARAAITAAVPAAADAGAEAFAKGGNAFDAAVAAALAETVWLPMKCGLAGDVVALYSRAGGPTRAILSLGRGPLALRQGVKLEATGPRSVGGFGAPEGYAKLASFGRLGLDELVAPAIRMAEEGVSWSPISVRLTVESEALIRRWNATTPYLPGGSLPKAGAPLRPRRLAELLRCFARDGAALFHGEAGDIVLSHLARLGGILTRDDLLRAVATEMPPERFDLGRDGAFLETTPHPTHGVIHGRALLAHLAGSPESVAVMDAKADFGAGADGGTSVVSAVDGEGNRVVLVHSNSYPRYGSGVIVPEFDLILNNRPGRGFAVDGATDHWNAPSPLSIPSTTLNAWHLFDGQADHWGGTPGGENQAVWNTQVTAALMQGCDPQTAISRPKWGLTPDRQLQWEEDHPDRPEGAKTVGRHAIRSTLQMLRIDATGETITAGVDPRAETAARLVVDPSID